ncbi:hypothetical protein [Corallococcus sicarius]|uniref:hypothetical protein n=1 Tax=Corallococcus sicarius TaxID=2316726 RepID=UPI0011C3E750|nr:hypothetical protein [Corallococcus sicarius]
MSDAFKSKHKTKPLHSRTLELLQQKGLKSKHFHFAVPSPALDAHIDEQLILAKTIHSFFRMNNINHAIGAGLLIGFYTSGEFLPFDDDIDIYLDADGGEFMNSLWENHTFPPSFVPEAVRRYPHWKAKGLRLQDGKEYLLMKNKFWKIRLIQSCNDGVADHSRDIGGVDIDSAILNADGNYYERAFPTRPMFNPTANNITMGTISGVTLPFPDFQTGGPYLDSVHGTHWREEILPARLAELTKHDIILTEKTFLATLANYTNDPQQNRAPSGVDG